MQWLMCSEVYVFLKQGSKLFTWHEFKNTIQILPLPAIQQFHTVVRGLVIWKYRCYIKLYQQQKKKGHGLLFSIQNQEHVKSFMCLITYTWKGMISWGTLKFVCNRNVARLLDLFQYRLQRILVRQPNKQTLQKCTQSRHFIRLTAVTGEWREHKSCFLHA